VKYDWGRVGHDRDDAYALESVPLSELNADGSARGNEAGPGTMANAGPSARLSPMIIAWARAGAAGGLLLGILGGIIIIASIFYSYGFTYYAMTLVGLAILASLAVGIVSGLIVGILNGVTLGIISRTAVLRSGTGVMRSRVSAITACTTGLSGLAVLYLLFRRDVLFVYPPAIAGALVATLLGRRLPPIRQWPTGGQG
jgi:hypothetical protein